MVRIGERQRIILSIAAGSDFALGPYVADVVLLASVMIGSITINLEN